MKKSFILKSVSHELVSNTAMSLRLFSPRRFPTRCKELASILRIRLRRFTFNRHVKWAREKWLRDIIAGYEGGLSEGVV
jgi:hypothetical protein